MASTITSGTVRIVALGLLVPALSLAAEPPRPAPSPTPTQWIEWGSRVHGGFGVLIALGIRIGEDALLRLGAARREVDVTYFDSPAAPCPCAVDGVLVAVSASPGQKTLRIADAPAGPGLFGEVLVRHRKTGEAVRFCLKAASLPLLLDGQKLPDFPARYDYVGALPAESLYDTRAGGAPCSGANSAAPASPSPGREGPR